MRAPAFQFYADDFFAGTAELSQREVGAYIRLLCHQWGRESIPCEPEKLHRIAGGPVSDSVLEKFPVGEDGLRRNHRMESERAKAQAFRDRQSSKGRAGAERRWGHKPDDGRTNGTGIAAAIAQAMPVLMPNDSSPSPSPSPEDKERGHEAPANPKTEPSERLKRFVKPTIEELTIAAQQCGLPDSEAQKFYNWFESNGWRVGKNPMRSWRGALGTWRARWEESRQSSAGSAPEPAWARRKRVEDRIEIHPCNPAWIGYDKSKVTDAHREDWRSLRVELASLK